MNTRFAIILSTTLFVATACQQTNDQFTDNKPVAHSEQTVQIEAKREKEQLAGLSKPVQTTADEIAPGHTQPNFRTKIATEAGHPSAPRHAPASMAYIPTEPVDRENYAHFDNNPLKLVEADPVSTFSIDVDTGAYSVVRRFLKNGNLPNQDSVRVEELINYFNYNYPGDEKQEAPFGVHTEIAPTPWNPDTLLLHVGIKAQEMERAEIPASNLVFLVDVSGSMHAANKLPLLKSSLKLLTQQMSEKDRISLVVYAGASGVVLEPTAGNDHAAISIALEQLRAGGSTNGGAGIKLAYAMAEKAFIKGGINRVILATDGDFNVGTTNFEALKQLVEQKRKSGIALTTLGFGNGNYNDHLMEQLADTGNGNYAYIDTINEAQKVLVDEISSTLNTVAKDVKFRSNSTLKLSPNTA